MKIFRMLSLPLLLVSLLLAHPFAVKAADTDTVVKVEKGDIVWSQSDTSGTQIYFSTYQAGSDSWTEPVKVTDDANKNGHPVIDEDSSGKRWLVWVAGTAGSSMIRYAVDSDGSWSAAQTVPSSLQFNVSPSVVVDNSGNPWVAWSGNSGGQDEIYCSSYQDGSWTTPVQVNSTNEVPDILPEITLDGKGEPQITWQGYRDGDYVQLQSTWDGKKWSDETQVSSTTASTTSTSTSSSTATTTTESSTSTDSSASASAASVGKAVASKAGDEISGSISNIPSFVPRPEKAFLRVYKSSVVQ